MTPAVTRARALAKAFDSFDDAELSQFQKNQQDKARDLGRQQAAFQREAAAARKEIHRRKGKSKCQS